MAAWTNPPTEPGDARQGVEMNNDTARIGKQAVDRNNGPDAGEQREDRVKRDAGSEQQDPIA